MMSRELCPFLDLGNRSSRGCSAAAGSTLGGDLPQASDSLDAIAALFRVSSGVGLCARVSLRGPSRR